MEVPDFRLRKNSLEKREKSSMINKKYLEPKYNSFGKGPHTSGYINSNTFVDLDSTGFGNLCLDFDKAYGVQVKVDGQSGVRYPSS
jgi:hypothetical protein